MDICDRFAADFHTMGVIKHGKFMLKSGVEVPVYFDSRVITSFPKVLDRLSIEVAKRIENTFGRDSFDIVCGVPYTAMSFAVLAAQKLDAPLIIKRKEPKKYGTLTSIDGKYKEGDRVVIIEDCVTSGTSVIEVAQALEAEGLRVVGGVSLLDREQGGASNLAQAGLKFTCLFKASEMLKAMEKAGHMDKKSVDSIVEFLRANPIPLSVKKVEKENGQALVMDMPGQEDSPNIGRKIFDIIRSKKTNLCFAVDVERSQEILDLADTLGPYICALKTHVDALIDVFDGRCQRKLVELARKHNFLIIEDRKLADIGKVSQRIFARLTQWADLVTVHALPGIDQVRGMEKAVTHNKHCGILLIAQMSCEGNLINAAYTQSCVDMARRFPGFVAGVIAQHANEIKGTGLSHFAGTNVFTVFTPGVNLTATQDAVGQRYSTPAEAIERGTDVVIVGRGISDYYLSEGGSIGDTVEAVEKYRIACFEPYKAAHAYELG